MTLSNSQKVFLFNLLKEKPVSRTYNNQSGRSLRKRGLVKYHIGFGWTLTESGIDAAKSIEDEVYLALHEVHDA